MAPGRHREAMGEASERITQLVWADDLHIGVEPPEGRRESGP